MISQVGNRYTIFDKQVTEKELQVMQESAEGLTSHDIADKHGIKYRTVKSRLTKLYSKFSIEKTSCSFPKIRLIKLYLEATGTFPKGDAPVSDIKFSPKELSILADIAAITGTNNIAENQHTTNMVIRNYIRSIFDKTGCWSRPELARWCWEHAQSLDIKRQEVEARNELRLTNSRRQNALKTNDQTQEADVTN